MSGTVCCYNGCGKSYVSDKDVSFFKFPDDPKRRKKWMQNCGNMDLESLPERQLRGKRICSDHFVTKSFIRPESKSALNDTAIPIVAKDIVEEEPAPVARKGGRGKSLESNSETNDRRRGRGIGRVSSSENSVDEAPVKRGRGKSSPEKTVSVELTPTLPPRKRGRAKESSPDTHIEVTPRKRGRGRVSESVNESVKPEVDVATVSNASKASSESSNDASSNRSVSVNEPPSLKPALETPIKATRGSTKSEAGPPTLEAASSHEPAVELPKNVPSVASAQTATTPQTPVKDKSTGIKESSPVKPIKKPSAVKAGNMPGSGSAKKVPNEAQALPVSPSKVIPASPSKVAAASPVKVTPVPALSPTKVLGKKSSPSKFGLALHTPKESHAITTVSSNDTTSSQQIVIISQTTGNAPKKLKSKKAKLKNSSNSEKKTSLSETTNVASQGSKKVVKKKKIGKEKLLKKGKLLKAIKSVAIAEPTKTVDPSEPETTSVSVPSKSTVSSKPGKKLNSSKSTKPNASIETVKVKSSSATSAMKKGREPPGLISMTPVTVKKSKTVKLSTHSEIVKPPLVQQSSLPESMEPIHTEYAAEIAEDSPEYDEYMYHDDRDFDQSYYEEEDTRGDREFERFYSSLKKMLKLSGKWTMGGVQWDPRGKQKVIMISEPEINESGRPAVKRCVQFFEDKSVRVFIDSMDMTDVFGMTCYAEKSDVTSLVCRVAEATSCCGVPQMVADDLAYFPNARKRNTAYFDENCPGVIPNDSYDLVCTSCKELQALVMESREREKCRLEIRRIRSKEKNFQHPFGEALYTMLSELVDESDPTKPKKKRTKETFFRKFLTDTRYKINGDVARTERIYVEKPISVDSVSASFQEVVSKLGFSMTNAQKNKAGGSGMMRPTPPSTSTPRSRLGHSSLGGMVKVERKLPVQMEHILPFTPGSSFTLDDGQEYELIGEVEPSGTEFVEMKPNPQQFEIIEVDDETLAKLASSKTPSVVVLPEAASNPANLQVTRIDANDPNLSQILKAINTSHGFKVT